MNVSPVHVLTVELAWMEFTTLPVFVQACLLENAVKVVLRCYLIIGFAGFELPRVLSKKDLGGY